jgi:hypothetical protein
MDAFVPVSDNFGQTLWSGHNLHTSGGPGQITPREIETKAARFSGSRRELEQSRLFQREAIDWATSHPVDDLLLIPGKVAYMAGGDSAALDDWVDPQPLTERVLGSNAHFRLGVLADAAWFALLTAALASIAIFGRALWRNRVLLAAGVYIGVLMLLYGIVLLGGYRYRAPFEPLLILIAAPLVVRLSTLRHRAPVSPEA